MTNNHISSGPDREKPRTLDTSLWPFLLTKEEDETVLVQPLSRAVAPSVALDAARSTAIERQTYTCAVVDPTLVRCYGPDGSTCRPSGVFDSALLVLDQPLLLGEERGDEELVRRWHSFWSVASVRKLWSPPPEWLETDDSDETPEGGAP